MGFLRYVAAKVKHVTESTKVMSNFCTKCGHLFELAQPSCPTCAKGKTKAGGKDDEHSRKDN